MSELKDKVVLVTGSSRGIGAAIAKAFAREGARVVVHGRDESAVARIREEIENAGGRAIGLLADVLDFAALEALREETERRFGPIEILVANAGGSFTNPATLFEDLEEEEFAASVDGNLTATFLSIKSVLRGMRARQSGIIITMSSAAGRRAHPRSPVPYGAAKAAIELMTQHLATQVGPLGIRVNCIAPETILTERNQQRIPDEQKRALIDVHPIRRLGTPEDIAAAALFLSTSASAWITGVILDVAGGAVMVR
jgi:3-oxoacyl-[acyl-carrier protein] reductase